MLSSSVFATVLLLVGLFSTTVVAQAQAGRDAYTRGSVGFGCYAARPTSQDNSTPYYQTSNGASAQACSDNCSVKRPQDANAPLFYYWQGSSQTCWCGNFYQRPQQQSSSNNPCYTGSGDTRNLWAYGRVSTTFTTYGAQCRTRAQTSSLADSAFTSGTQIGPVSCMRQCRSQRFAYYWSDNSSNNIYRCACSNTIVASQTTAATCGPGNVFVWEHSVLAQASALDRRKRRASPENEKEFSLCPAGYTACAVRGPTGVHVEHGYECIDTSRELESCGGCIDGYMMYSGTIVTEYDGVNCAANGAALGGASCVDGVCQISSCVKGYQLADGICKATGFD